MKLVQLGVGVGVGVASGTPAGEWVERAVDALKPETQERKGW